MIIIYFFYGKSFFIMPIYSLHVYRKLIALCDSAARRLHIKIHISWVGGKNDDFYSALPKNRFENNFVGLSK